MKKVPLLITGGIILLIVAGYYGYEKFIVDRHIRMWDLVPADAIVVYEKNNCNSCLDEVANSVLLDIVERAAFYKEPVDSIRAKINSVLKKKSNVFISAHVTRKDDFDFVFYLPFGKELDDTELFNRSTYKRTAREFNAVQIHEVKSSSQVFSYAIIGDVWIGSFTPFLIEDVVRTYKTRSTSNDHNNNLRIEGFTGLKDDAGNLYIRLDQFSDLLSIFSAKAPGLQYAMGRAAGLDVKVKENSFVLNGFSSESTDESKNILSIFKHQSPVSFGLKHLISNRSVAVSSYGISDGRGFYTDLKKFVQKNNPRIQDTLNQLSVSHRFDVGGLYDAIADELGVCFVESSSGKKLAKFLLIESSSSNKWLKTFDGLAQKLSIDTIFYEKFSQYEIREIPVYRFSEKLFWPLVSGFNQNFYTSVGDVIIIGDNLEELKDLLADIEAEDTWGKSVAQNRFLETTLLESNVSLYFNPSKSWNLLTENLHPKWISFVKENQAMLQSLQMSSIQFSHLSNSYYTNLLFTTKPFDASDTPTPKSRDRVITNFDRGLLNLHAVKSHINRGNELLIQDSLNDLSLVSSEGKILWKLPIGDRIISDVTQIDYFNNGKLQYFFSTARAIHIIDRLGNYVDPFPLHLSSTEIEHVSVLDYDNSKRYRILIADRKGKLWMFDKAGKPLDGWKPKDVGGSLAMAPRHHRIKGRDYLLAVRKDGQVFLMNRRAENLRKFPQNIDAVPSGNYSLEMGASAESTYFVVVSQDGFKIKFNVLGKIQSKEALMKTSVTSNFSLINEKANKSYLILQQDGKQAILSDDSGKRIISSNLSGIDPRDVQYYNFGSGNAFITLTDRIQGFSYIYDEQGDLLTSPPIESTAIEIRPVNSEQIRVFFIHGSSLTIQPL